MFDDGNITHDIWIDECWFVALSYSSSVFLWKSGQRSTHSFKLTPIDRNIIHTVFDNDLKPTVSFIMQIGISFWLWWIQWIIAQHFRTNFSTLYANVFILMQGNTLDWDRCAENSIVSIQRNPWHCLTA